MFAGIFAGGGEECPDLFHGQIVGAGVVRLEFLDGGLVRDPSSFDGLGEQV